MVPIVVVVVVVVGAAVAVVWILGGATLAADLRKEKRRNMSWTTGPHHREAPSSPLVRIRRRRPHQTMMDELRRTSTCRTSKSEQRRAGTHHSASKPVLFLVLPLLAVWPCAATGEARCNRWLQLEVRQRRSYCCGNVVVTSSSCAWLAVFLAAASVAGLQPYVGLATMGKAHVVVYPSRVGQSRSSPARPKLYQQQQQQPRQDGQQTEVDPKALKTANVESGLNQRQRQQQLLIDQLHEHQKALEPALGDLRVGDILPNFQVRSMQDG